MGDYTEAGGLVERLRDMGGGEHAVATCKEAADAIEAMSTSLASERAAHAETKRERDGAMDALELISHMHDSNPPLPLADMPELDYARRTISNMRRAAHEAARRVREGGKS